MSPRSQSKFQSWPTAADVAKLFNLERITPWEYDIFLAMLKTKGEVSLDGKTWIWDPRVPGWQQTI